MFCFTLGQHCRCAVALLADILKLWANISSRFGIPWCGQNFEYDYCIWALSTSFGRRIKPLKRGGNFPFCRCFGSTEASTHRIEDDFEIINGLAVVSRRRPQQLVTIRIGRRDDPVLDFGDDGRLLGRSALGHRVHLLAGPFTEPNLILGRKSEHVHQLRLQVLQNVRNICGIKSMRHMLDRRKGIGKWNVRIRAQKTLVNVKEKKAKRGKGSIEPKINCKVQCSHFSRTMQSRWATVWERQEQQSACHLKNQRTTCFSTKKITKAAV